MINMKKAIIDPRETVSKVIGYDAKGNSILQVIPNSARVAEVADAEFPIAEPLFWVSCANEVKADQWYYDTVQQQCFAVPPPAPPADQPVSQGTQDL